MKKIFNEAGRLTEEGKAATQEFKEMARSFVASGQDENEVSIIGSLLSSMIADVTLDEKIRKK